jgi:hypothetical protein
MLDHLSHTLFTFSILATVGLRAKAIRPLPIEDLVQVLHAALVEKRLPRKTIAVTGADQPFLRDAIVQIAELLGRKVLIVSAPIIFHRVLAQVCEWTMKVPLVTKAQVRILSEGVVGAAGATDPLPADLLRKRHLTAAQLRAGLPQPGPFGVRDLRCWG